jgi:hypothetical protein
LRQQVDEIALRAAALVVARQVGLRPDLDLEVEDDVFGPRPSKALEQGRLALTPMLTEAGKLYGDLTIARFRPERFIGRPADPSTWLPFGGGIRRCIGAAFAMMEIKTVLRTVLSETQLKPASPKLRPSKPPRKSSPKQEASKPVPSPAGDGAARARLAPPRWGTIATRRLFQRSRRRRNIDRGIEKGNVNE